MVIGGWVVGTKVMKLELEVELELVLEEVWIAFWTGD